MKRVTAVIALSGLVLAACGGDDDSITIENEWARQSPMGATRGAVYFDITAADDDTLVAASVASDIAGIVEIHEVVPAEMDMESEDMGDMEGSDDMEGDMESEDMGDMEGSGDMEDDMEHMDGMGAMVMQELAGGLGLPAGETVTLEPGGYHVMLIDLVEPLEIGQEFDVTLEFENADDVELTVEVFETAP